MPSTALSPFGRDRLRHAHAHLAAGDLHAAARTLNEAVLEGNDADRTAVAEITAALHRVL